MTLFYFMLGCYVKLDSSFLQTSFAKSVVVTAVQVRPQQAHTKAPRHNVQQSNAKQVCNRITRYTKPLPQSALSVLLPLPARPNPFARSQLRRSSTSLSSGRLASSLARRCTLRC